MVKEIGQSTLGRRFGVFLGKKTRKVKFDVVLEPKATYYPVAKDLSERIRSEARRRGVFSDTLVNLWPEQKIKEQKPTRTARGS